LTLGGSEPKLQDRFLRFTVLGHALWPAATVPKRSSMALQHWQQEPASVLRGPSNWRRVRQRRERVLTRACATGARTRIYVFT
jgi:hypothetical protein